MQPSSPPPLKPTLVRVHRVVRGWIWISDAAYTVGIPYPLSLLARGLRCSSWSMDFVQDAAELLHNAAAGTQRGFSRDRPPR